MSQEQASAADLKKGQYSPVKPSDTRSPCPAINALANHGYLPRDGRNVHPAEVLDGMNHLGLGAFLAYIFTHPIFLVEQKANTKQEASWWDAIAHPFNHALAFFGMRKPDQIDQNGTPILNIDQLALHNVVEHDVSLTRHDFGQGDNLSPQPDLIEELLQASSNGKTITIDDFVKLRKRRYEEQKKNNPELDFGPFRLQLACTEVALILKVLGNGKEVPVSYVRAFFKEGRLPQEEGWSKRKFWPVGFIELNVLASKVKGLLGAPGEGAVPVVNAIH